MSASPGGQHLDPPFTYPEVGRTREGEGLPDGYDRLRVTAPVGHGRALFEAAGEAVLDWSMHRAVGVRIAPHTPRAAPGVEVTPELGVGPLRVAAPCRVVWTVDDERRTGFAYGTLPGHPERGEEAFVVEFDGDAVTLTVTAFSRPARWYTRAAARLVPLFQRAYARRCGRMLAREASRRTR
ncbi:DUF1990 family protein [Wenjunlia tyrosinilytica]|uniref:DUF1990 family protein n=1 Tax=Wenjunlia tyrosinilytica TaxID=1544741 RepID=UPI00166D6FBC|nr:DUF1990 domain-containing protein [Wenjunlia tyrosinilytica]